MICLTYHDKLGINLVETTGVLFFIDMYDNLRNIMFNNIRFCVSLYHVKICMIVVCS